MGVLGDTFAEETGVADIVKFFCSEVVVSCSREIRGSDVYFQRQEVAFRVTDADVVRACTIGNRAVASRGSSRQRVGGNGINIFVRHFVVESASR